MDVINTLKEEPASETVRVGESWPKSTWLGKREFPTVSKGQDGLRDGLRRSRKSSSCPDICKIVVSQEASPARALTLVSDKTQIQIYTQQANVDKGKRGDEKCSMIIEEDKENYETYLSFDVCPTEAAQGQACPVIGLSPQNMIAVGKTADIVRGRARANTDVKEWSEACVLQQTCLEEERKRNMVSKCEDAYICSEFLEAMARAEGTPHKQAHIALEMRKRGFHVAMPVALELVQAVEHAASSVQKSKLQKYESPQPQVEIFIDHHVEQASSRNDRDNNMRDSERASTKEDRACSGNWFQSIASFLV